MAKKATEVGIEPVSGPPPKMDEFKGPISDHEKEYYDMLAGKMEDSGVRVDYEGGGTREPATGKGRYDLISPFALERLAHWDVTEDLDFSTDTMVSSIFRHINHFRMGDRTVDHLAAAARYAFEIMHFEETRGLEQTEAVIRVYKNISPFALARLAKWYELGSIKYNPRNWEAGMSFTRLLDSAQRHLNRWCMGGRTEDHLAAVAWNCFAYMHYERVFGEDSKFNDTPLYSEPDGSPIVVFKCNHQVDEPVIFEPNPSRYSEDQPSTSSVYDDDGYPITENTDGMYNWLSSVKGGSWRKFKVYAVDFDGCLVKNKWPKVGRVNITLIETLKRLQSEGHEVILWTCREGDMLLDALKALETYGFEPDYVNESCPADKAQFKNDPRKINADAYIDDKAIAVITE